MKAKLLREVRKRYGIYTYPNGFDDGPFVNTKNYSLVLRDDLNMVLWFETKKSIGGLLLFNVGGRQMTEKEVIQQLKNEMLRKILIAYKDKGVRRMNRQKVRKKVYYNENITNK